MPARPRPMAAPFLLSLMLALVAAPGGRAAEKLPPPSKYGVYLLGIKAGQMTTAYQEATFEQKPVVRIDSSMTVKIEALGEVEQKVLVRSYVTPKGDPVYMRSEVSALGRQTTILARFFPDRVECDVDASGQKARQKVPIPKGVKLTGDRDFNTLTREQLKVGDKETFYIFEPTSLSIQKISTQVLRKEKLKVGSRMFDTFVVSSSQGGSLDSTEWITEDGELLQSEMKLGLKLVREDFGEIKQTYTPPQNFMAATAVRTERKIERPRTARALKVRVSGIPDRELVLSDPRQKATQEGMGEGMGEALAVVFEMTAQELPERGAPAEKSPQGNPMLADAPYLGVNDPAIQKQAREIVGEETDRAAIARRIRAWVHARINKPRNAGVLRSATEIMANQDGVCREFATLFTALARAAGVPTRLCGGIIYFEDAFYYHAWVECQLTDSADGWYAFDPTLAEDFVDATHIKFSQGDVTDMFQASRVVGHLKAEVLDYR